MHIVRSGQRLWAFEPVPPRQCRPPPPRAPGVSSLASNVIAHTSKRTAAASRARPPSGRDRGHPAVDGDVGAVDVGRTVAGEKRRQLGHFLGGPEAT